MKRWEGKVAVVTGASSGIGSATAKALVCHGLIVVGLARRKSKMENEMKDVKIKGKFYAVECDLTREQQIIDAFQWIKSNLKTVDILINNAATLKMGKISDLPYEELKKIIDLNLSAVLLCSKLAINIMKEKNQESHVVMINSVVCHRINRFPSKFHTNLYAVTKSAMKALSTILELELYGENVRITNISPGAVKTELLDIVVGKNNDIFENYDLLQSEDIADAVLYVLGTPPRVRIEELIIKPNKAPY